MASIYVHDIEIYKNLFMVTIKSLSTGEIKVYTIYSFEGEDYYIDDSKTIINFYNNKRRWFVGYNSRSFDNQIINTIIHYRRELFLKRGNIDQKLNVIYKSAMKIINGDNSRKYDYNFGSIDVMSVGGLRKSLKLVGINLKWHEIQDNPFKVGSIIEPDQIDKVKEYNLNDVLMTERVYMKLKKAIELRSAISIQYNVNCMDESDSSIANKILAILYSRESKQSISDFKDLRTIHNKFKLETCIDSNIKFNKKALQDLLLRLKSIEIDEDDKKFEEKILLGSTMYTIAKGGLHSNNSPGIIEPELNESLIDADVSSYYPAIILKYGICPKHIDKNHFLSILSKILKERLQAKKQGDKTKSDSYKILANSIYGKFGYINHWLYDLLALYSVTINGQLLLLRLIEVLEERGFKVIYANTDGITTIVSNNRKKEYFKICEYWMKHTSFKLEFVELSKFIIKDVNNYLMITKNGETKGKGALDKNRHEDLMKGFDMPIVPISIHEYFLNQTPIEKTIKNHTDVLDFCKSVRIGPEFDMFSYELEDNNIKKTKLQRTNRYIVSPNGVSLQKEAGKKQIKILKGESVTIVNKFDPNKTYNIKYEYYIQETRKILFPIINNQASLFD